MTTMEWARVGVVVLCLLCSAGLAYFDKEGWGWFMFFALLTACAGADHA